MPIVITVTLPHASEPPMICSPVLTKADFVRRYQRNEFGNRSPTWDTVGEFVQSGPHKGLFHIRNRVAGGSTHYNCYWGDVLVFASTESTNGYYVSGMAPHNHNLIQGEVQVVPEQGGLQLRYSTKRGVPMREALTEAHHTKGIIANLLLRAYLCPNSYEWLQILLARYPGHVVEFSCFDINWGTIPNYNTVTWEVRLY